MARYNIKYDLNNLSSAVASNVSVAGVLRTLGVRPSGGSHSHISRRISKFGISTSHFIGQAHNRGKTSNNRKHFSEWLSMRQLGQSRGSASRITIAMKEAGIPHVCELCGCGPTWNGKTLTLQIDHKNGNWLDYRQHNVRFLCPNCHSQTPTFGSKNIGNGKVKHRVKVHLLPL